jgi:2-succinyl-5-enolpyruvyl-6-hydroxy-3-cyclohexene-1-carboxylate synthase
MSDAAALALRAYVGAFVDELARCGVRDVCVCPGSRSAPLAVLLLEHPRIKVWTHLDERSASYFALGMAKATGRPVAVLCTSGTAAANFMPAVAEAHNAQAPLLLLTADRPQELRDVGALQTIDQVRLYGSHAKWAAEMLLPEATDMAVRHARYAADRAVATALSVPMGPVHLNFPFREPLLPAPPDGQHFPAEGAPQTRVTPVPLPQLDATAIIEHLGASRRPLVVLGPAEVERVSCLDELVRAGIPVLADAFSQARCQSPSAGVIDRFDAFLRDEDTAAALAFDCALRVGALPVSKPLQQFLDRNVGAAQAVMSPPGAWPDPSHSATEVVWLAGDPSAAGDGAAAADRAAWLGLWQRANATAAAAIESALAASARMSEPLVFRRLADLVPEDSIVFAGNSMPVRDLDSFWPASPKRVRFLANRGASGIDGVVSTALGAAAASQGKRVVLVIGDLSLYHDMNGLLAARRHGLSATVVLINNDGGGIFSFLPQHDRRQDFEELFGTPHGLDFRHAADLYGLSYAAAGTPAEFDAAVHRSLDGEGVDLVEVRTDREENLALHRRIWADVSAALARERVR